MHGDFSLAPAGSATVALWPASVGVAEHQGFTGPHRGAGLRVGEEALRNNWEMAQPRLGAPGETWGGIHVALVRGRRGLPKASLYQVLWELRPKRIRRAVVRKMSRTIFANQPPEKRLNSVSTPYPAWNRGDNGWRP